MAFTLGAAPAAANANGTTTASVGSTAYTSGRQLVALIYWRDNTQTITSVVYDPGGPDERTFTAIGATLECADGDAIAIAYLSNIPATKSTTIQLTWSDPISTDSGGMMIRELIGGDTTDALDNAGSGSGSGTSLSCSFATNTDNCCIFVVASSASSDPAASGGYSVLTLANVFSFVNGEFLLDVGTAGTQTPTMTANSGTWGIKAAAFKLQSVIVAATIPISTSWQGIFQRAN